MLIMVREEKGSIIVSHFIAIGWWFQNTSLLAEENSHSLDAILWGVRFGGNSLDIHSVVGWFQSPNLLPSGESTWVATPKLDPRKGGQYKPRLQVVSNIFVASPRPYLGRYSNLTNSLQTGWNHQLFSVLAETDPDTQCMVVCFYIYPLNYLNVGWQCENHRWPLDSGERFSVRTMPGSWLPQKDVWSFEPTIHFRGLCHVSFREGNVDSVHTRSPKHRANFWAFGICPHQFITPNLTWIENNPRVRKIYAGPDSSRSTHGK